MQLAESWFLHLEGCIWQNLDFCTWKAAVGRLEICKYIVSKQTNDRNALKTSFPSISHFFSLPNDETSICYLEDAKILVTQQSTFTYHGSTMNEALTRFGTMLPFQIQKHSNCSFQTNPAGCIWQNQEICSLQPANSPSWCSSFCNALSWSVGGRKLHVSVAMSTLKLWSNAF